VALNQRSGSSTDFEVNLYGDANSNCKTNLDAKSISSGSDYDYPGKPPSSAAASTLGDGDSINDVDEGDTSHPEDEMEPMYAPLSLSLIGRELVRNKPGIDESDSEKGNKSNEDGNPTESDSEKGNRSNEEDGNSTESDKSVTRPTKGRRVKKDKVYVVESILGHQPVSQVCYFINIYCIC
jgi:hypothetical protein